MKIIFNDTELEVLETDDSFRYRKIMGENTLTLYFAGPNFLEIPLGAYVMYEGEKYTLTQNEDFKKVSSQHYDYTIMLCGTSSTLSHIKVRNTVDRRLKFSYTAKPHEHLQMIVDNLNQRDSGWSVGSCVDASEKVLSYNFTYCIDALAQLADLFETEYDIRNKTISLCKVEYNKDNPLALAYGVGNGFKPNIGRKVPSNAKVPVEVLFVQGGEDNIDFSKYGSAELLLPKLQSLTYEGREYVTDADGYSIRRNDKDIQYNNEDEVDCTHIYPKRVGEVTSVVVEDVDNNFYDIIDTTIPDNLNYEDYLIDGETMTIIFQSGMLSGREFDVKYCHEATDDKAGKRFEIVPQELDGQTMPNETFRPQPEDTYAVFNCYLPDSYICDNDTQTGASWDMFREAAKYFYENEDPKFTFEGELDGLWSKSRWLEIGGKITIGGYVLFSDEDFEQEGVKIRTIGIKDYTKKPHAPELELSNDVTGISVGTELDKIAAQEVDIIEAKKSAIRYARRGFRDVKETSEMLTDALLNFSGEINPIVVKTMQLIAGDESLQFRFVNNMTAPTTASHVIVFNSATKILTSEAGIIQHMTLGVSLISSTHSVSEYKFWNVAQYTSPALTDPDKKYYLYIKASKSDQTATMLLSETAIALEGVADYYHFLVGFLNSEYDESRSFATLHGYSEVLPGQITTPLICSSDGLTYFNLDIGEIGGRIVFTSTSGTTTTVADGINGAQSTANEAIAKITAEEEARNAALATINSSIASLQSQVDGEISNWFYAYAPTLSNYPANEWSAEEKARHIGDTFTNTASSEDGDNTAGQSWRFVVNSGVYSWSKIADSDAVLALQNAALAQSTADGKSTTYIVKPTSYSLGDMWILESAYTLNNISYKTGEILTANASSSSFVSSHWSKNVCYTDDTTANLAVALANTVKNTIAQQFGYTNYDTMVASAKASSPTIIDGGYINTTLIDVAVLLAGKIFSNALNIGNGNFEVDINGNMVANNANITGNVNATSGSFTGTINATSGVFAGGVISPFRTVAGTGAIVYTDQGNNIIVKSYMQQGIYLPTGEQYDGLEVDIYMGINNTPVTIHSANNIYWHGTGYQYFRLYGLYRRFNAKCMAGGSYWVVMNQSDFVLEASSGIVKSVY